jgi:hypothetical protein
MQRRGKEQMRFGEATQPSTASQPLGLGPRCQPTNPTPTKPGLPRKVCKSSPTRSDTIIISKNDIHGPVWKSEGLCRRASFVKNLDSLCCTFLPVFDVDRGMGIQRRSGKGAFSAMKDQDHRRNE